MDFGELRSILHSTPSEGAWASLCEYFANVREEPMISQALDYALPHLRNHWPSNLRTLPEAWFCALIERDSYNRRLDHPHMMRLIELATALDASRYRSIRSNDLAQAVATSPMPWVESFVAPRGVMDTSDLGAISAMVSGGGVRHLTLDDIDSPASPRLGPLALGDWLMLMRPARFKQVRSLSLTRSQATNSTIANLLSTKQYFGLTALDLSYNAIDDDIVQHFKNAALSKGLKHLVLHGNPISARAILALTDSNVLPHLRALGVRGIALTEEDLEVLAARNIQVVREDAGVVMRAFIANRQGHTREKVLHGDRITIGRIRENEIMLPFANISKRHVEVWCEGGLIWARDYGSSGGTFVNGAKIQGNRRLRREDRMYLGDFILRFEAIEDPG